MYIPYRNFFILLVMVFFQKKPTMADFRFLRAHFFLVNPVPIYLSLELHVTTHSYIPHPVWSVLLCCPRLACLELTACEGMWDAALASLLQDNPGSLANIVRWHDNGNDNDNDNDNDNGDD